MVEEVPIGTRSDVGCPGVIGRPTYRRLADDVASVSSLDRPMVAREREVRSIGMVQYVVATAGPERDHA